MIETAALSKSYGDRTVLADLSVSVARGEVLGLVGPNGAGKTTTVKILAGLIVPSAGTARVAGFDIVGAHLDAKRRVGYMPEAPKLFEYLAAGEYVDFIARLHELQPNTARSRRNELFDTLGLSEVSGRRIGQLSKGMRQKVALSAALLHNPDVLLLDEPLDGLDLESAMMVKELVRQLALGGKTILLSSHMASVVAEIATRVLVIEEGRQVALGSPVELCRSVGAATLEEALGLLLRIDAPAERAARLIARLGVA